MIVYDQHSEFSKLLSDIYQLVLPDAEVFDLDATGPGTILENLNTLSPGDLVILIQSTSFRLSKFRVRIELFKQHLKVIEHPHLFRLSEEEFSVYVDALSYDPSYYRTVGPLLKERIRHASEIRLIGEDTELVYDTSFLDPKLNIGDYEGLENIGGQFPIGEVFTEPTEIHRVNGTVKLFAFGDTDFSVNVPDKPFMARIERGILVSTSGAPEDFLSVLDEIRDKEEVVWIRELGFGLNRAFTRDRKVTDIGAYERMCGIHLSLGAKHLQYKKSGFPKKGGFHVDVFVEVLRVEIDGVCVFREGAYEVSSEV